MKPSQRLLNDIEEFCRRHGLTVTGFGTAVVNDTAFVHKLRKGRSVTLETAERVRSYMAAYEAASRPTMPAGNAHAAA